VPCDPQSSDIKPASAAIPAAGADTALPNAVAAGEGPDTARRGPKAKPAIEPCDVQGLKYFEKLRPLLARLHAVGTERDKAVNRELQMDEYCIPLAAARNNMTITLNRVRLFEA